MFDMRALPTAAATLTELSERDQAILRDVAGGLSPKEIAERIDIPEDELYRFIAWVLEEIQPAPNGDTMREVYARHASRPVSPSDIEEFERRFGPSLPSDDETSTSSRTTASTATGRHADRCQAAGVLPVHAIPKEPHQAGECSMRARGDKALSKGVVLGQSSDLEILDMRCTSEPGEQRLMVFRADGKRVTGLVIAHGRRESLYALDLPTAFVIAELPFGVSSLSVPYRRL
jgi:hypothetical protein